MSENKSRREGLWSERARSESAAGDSPHALSPTLAPLGSGGASYDLLPHSEQVAREKPVTLELLAEYIQEVFDALRAIDIRLERIETTNKVKSMFPGEEGAPAKQAV